MNSFNKALFVLIVIMVLQFMLPIINFTDVHSNNNANIAAYAQTAFIQNKAELETVTYKLIKYIRNKNTDGILSLLPRDYKVEVGIDEYMGYEELRKEFTNKGEFYNFLFDSEEFNSRLRKINPHHKPRLCIRDQILDKKVSILDFNVLTKRPVLMVQVYITWDGKDYNDKTLLSYFGFNYDNGRWVLASLNCTEI